MMDRDERWSDNELPDDDDDRGEPVNSRDAEAALVAVEDLIISDLHLANDAGAVIVNAADGRLRLADGRQVDIAEYVDETIDTIVSQAEIAWRTVPHGIRHAALHALHRLQLHVEKRLDDASRDHGSRATTVIMIGRVAARIHELENRDYRAVRAEALEAEEEAESDDGR